LQQINKDHKQQLDELEPNATASKEEYERKLQLASTDHTMQLDELLAQLDLVEAEHKEKMSETEKATTEKDTIIAALGAELADARTYEKEIDVTHKKLTVDLARVQEQAAQAKEDVEKLKGELETSKATHDKFMSGEVDRRERACEEAVEEMIERAELQFKTANDLYIKLKRQYDSTIDKVVRLESELKSMKTKLEKVKNEKEDSLADLKAEVADLKATNATTGSDAAQRAKEYRREMEGLLKAANDFERKLEDSEATTHSLQSSMSAVVGAKMKLQQEYDEMKNVCEELMVMVEGQPQDRHEC
jgi:chromosome segregation ATPase